jgi:hypothetical protein
MRAYFATKTARRVIWNFKREPVLFYRIKTHFYTHPAFSAALRLTGGQSQLDFGHVI